MVTHEHQENHPPHPDPPADTDTAGTDRHPDVAGLQPVQAPGDGAGGGADRT